jgi:hypothetical protein
MEVGKLDEAKADLEAAKKLDPESKAIAKAFKKLATVVAADKELRKKKFGGMFKKAKGGLYNDQPNPHADPTKDPKNKRVRTRRRRHRHRPPSSSPPSAIVIATVRHRHRHGHRRHLIHPCIHDRHKTPKSPAAAVTKNNSIARDRRENRGAAEQPFSQFV